MLLYPYDPPVTCTDFTCVENYVNNCQKLFKRF